MKIKIPTKARYIAANILLIGSLVAWPVSALTVAKHEPQFVLGLSWFAIALTAMDLSNTLSVKLHQEEEGNDTSEAE